METDTRRRCCRKNAKVLRIGIEKSERLVKQKAAAVAKAARLTKEQAHAARRLAGFVPHIRMVEQKLCRPCRRGVSFGLSTTMNIRQP